MGSVLSLKPANKFEVNSNVVTQLGQDNRFLEVRKLDPNRWSDGYLISHDVAAGICFFLDGLPGAEAQIGIYPRVEETAKGEENEESYWNCCIDERSGALN